MASSSSSLFLPILLGGEGDASSGVATPQTKIKSSYSTQPDLFVKILYKNLEAVFITSSGWPGPAAQKRCGAWLHRQRVRQQWQTTKGSQSQVAVSHMIWKVPIACKISPSRTLTQAMSTPGARVLLRCA